ncbi:MAG: PH domain-containing protein [Candidatus Saccharimonadales bacterium]
MVSLRNLDEQLKRVGCNFRFWGRSEIRELSNVLMTDETIMQCVNGVYEGGFAMLCITQYRVLLIDRKPMMLTIEDLRYDMIAEVDFNNRVVNATLRIFTPVKNLVFSSWSQLRLRKSVNYIQQRVMELRQHNMTAQQLQMGSQPGMPQLLSQSSTINPYTKVPLLSRRRRFPSFY